MSLLYCKQVKIDKNNANNSVISTILRHKNYRQLTALRYYSPHVPTPLHGDKSPTDGGFRLLPTRWRPESGSSI